MNRPRPAPRVLACASVEPPYVYGTEEIQPYLLRWLRSKDPTLVDRLEKIVASIQIARRASAIPLDQVFAPAGFEAKNNRYIESAIEHAGRAFAAGIERADVAPEEIDFLITTSCTGFMIPSVDAHLVNRFGLKPTVQRLPVLQMGCAGGTSALIYASDYLRAHPDRHVAVVTAEFPSITFQENDLSIANIVSTALFADGAACAVLGGAEVEARTAVPAIVDTQMVHIPDTTSLMGYQLVDSGLQIMLERGVPDVIEANLDRILFPFLERNGQTIDALEHLIFHPGSIKILARTEALLAPHGKDLAHSHEVLAQHGNMSSATVLYILERVLESKTAAGDLGLMLSFGPGFCGQTLLLEWR